MVDQQPERSSETVLAAGGLVNNAVSNHLEGHTWVITLLGPTLHNDCCESQKSISIQFQFETIFGNGFCSEV